MTQSILITGCSSGIGLATAKHLQQLGFQVFATARKNEDVKMLTELDCHAIALDLNDSYSIDKAVKWVLEKTGGTLDILFNNAGFAQPGAVEDLSREQIRYQFEGNVFGTLELTNLIVPVMRQQGHGLIMTTSSMLGIITLPYRGAYNASKFALEGFMDTLRQELSSTPINVVLIEPGPIQTAFRDNAHQRYQHTLAHETSQYHQKAYEKIVKKMTNKQQAVPGALPPESVAKLVATIIAKKRPQARYFITYPSRLLASWLKRLFPTRWLDRLLLMISRDETT